MNNMILELSNITKEYEHKDGKVFALKDLSLSVDEGDFVVVTGASGSGKTTLLLIIGGLLYATSGKMHINGRELNLQAPKELDNYRSAHVGYVMQNFALIPYLSATENVELAIQNKSLSSKDKSLRAIALLELVGLSQRRNHLPKELSAGQQQRVAIARALANAPSIILADEPTGNLDPALSAEIMELLKKINSDQKTTIIMVTHSEMAAGYGNRNIKISNGQIIK
jgi:putative ABC transport system ATP-binding protein